MENLCFWPCDQITELHLNIAQAPLRCLPGRWMHQSSSDQCRGKETWKESHIRQKVHLYEAHSLRITVTVHQYPLWDLLLMLLYTTEITTTACKTKSTWVAIWIGALCALHEADIWACSLSHYKDTLPFRSAKWRNTVPICRENNALSHPDGLPLIKQYVISISYIGN